MPQAKKYKSALKAAKLQWRYGYAGIYKTLFPNGIPANTFAALLPWYFVGRGGKVIENSQPEIFTKLGIAKPEQMVCVDGSINEKGKIFTGVVTSNKRAKGFHHHYGRMSNYVERYDCALVDYDGMRSPRHEIREVISIIEALNNKNHETALLVNCQKRKNGMLTKYIKGTVFDLFKKDKTFRHAIRKGKNYVWEVVSRPMENLTSRTLMETFVLFKRMKKATNKRHEGALKAWVTRRANA